MTRQRTEKPGEASQFTREIPRVGDVLVERGLITAKQIERALAFHPAKVRTPHGCDRGVRSTVKLATHGAVAVGCQRKKFVDFEFYGPAITMTAQLVFAHGLLPVESHVKPAQGSSR